ncbi:MAG: DUF2892 domain-containing protein [Proteobacteria bacterium]|nr:DUF2892 domain-containing protein [Pseudomonadota bacterium]
MKLNVGNLESFIRIFAGVCLLYGTLYGTFGTWGYLGIGLIATGLGRFSPLYSILGINKNSCNSGSSH